jgi:hypothetical protein
MKSLLEVGSRLRCSAVRFPAGAQVLAPFLIAAGAFFSVGTVPGDPRETAPGSPPPASTPALPADPLDSAADPAAVSCAESLAVAESLIADGRESLKHGTYDQGIRILKRAISLTQCDRELLGQAYLVLVSTYVQCGNYYKNEPQGGETSALYYEKAANCVDECMSRPNLRHLRPIPASRYPPEMHEMFRRTRERMFGSLRILVASPRDARVTLDGDTLSVAPGDSAFEALDLPLGAHQLHITREGFRDLRESVRINAGSTAERTYSLRRHRSALWYAGRASLGISGAVVYLATRKEARGMPPRPRVAAPPGFPH